MSDIDINYEPLVEQILTHKYCHSDSSSDSDCYSESGSDCDESCSGSDSE